MALGRGLYINLGSLKKENEYIIIEKSMKIEKENNRKKQNKGGIKMQHHIESKGKLFGEIFAILSIQFIMLVFRLVEPIQWPSLFPGKYTAFLNEFAYFGIEFGLAIVIVAHFIFGISFKELGMDKIKENIGMLILNGLFLGVSIGMAYFMSLFSKNVEVHWMELLCQVITNFIAIAFLKEVIFRGFLFRSVSYLINGKAILASIITAIFFAGTYIPTILIHLNEITLNVFLQELTIPFVMGIYLGLVYYYTRNLWTVTIFHGTFISLFGLEQDFAICALEIIYAIYLFVYLVIKMVKHYKGDIELQEDDKALAESLEQKEEVPQIVQTNEDYKENQIEASTGVNEKAMQTQQENATKEEATVVQIPNFSELKEEKYEEVQKVKEPTKTIDLDSTLVMPAIPDDPTLLQELIEEQAEQTPDLLSVLSTDMEEEEEKVCLQENVTYEAEPNYIAHLEKYLGQFEAIYKQMIPTNPPIDILYFKGEKANALVTSGMRKLPMNIPSELKDYQNIELMMYVDKHFDLSTEGLRQHENAWLIKLLADMAVYPSMTNSYLGWGHIVGNGMNMEPYDESVKYCGAIVYPSINEVDVNFSRYKENNVNVFIYNVMPLYKEELKFVQEQSGEQFVNLMASMGVSQIITPKRMNVVSRMKSLKSI